MKMMVVMMMLWILMLSGGAHAQSGEPDTDMVFTASSVSCTSHISLRDGTNISCQLISRGFDLDDEDEDEDEDAIERMTACCCGLGQVNKTCVHVLGETLSSEDLNPISDIALTVWSKRGHRIEKRLDVKKIIKPKSPQVRNVTLNQDHALVQVQIPYENDYLKEKNLLLQLQLWSEKTNQTQNMTSGSVIIGWDYLHRGTQYRVRARAVPWIDFQGTWSEWSPAYTFHTPPNPPGEDTGEASEKVYKTLWSVVPVVLVVIVVVALMWRNKIQTYMWPSIPKATLEKICGPNNGPLLFCIPEEFTVLNVSTTESLTAEPSCGEASAETKESPSCPTETKESPSCSPQSTGMSMSSSSAGTEEVELLSHCSSEEEELRADTAPDEHNSAQHEKDHSYVTMSSFQQIKPPNLTCSN